MLQTFSPDGGDTGRFGQRIVISGNGNNMFVSAPFIGSGRVFHYQWNGGNETWSLAQTLEPESDAEFSQFGSALSCNREGFRLVVGAPNHSPLQGGMVYLFQWDGEKFPSPLTLGMQARSQAYAHHGSAVGIDASGTLIVAGADNATWPNAADVNTGTYQLYSLSDSGTWNFGGGLRSRFTSGATGDQLGASAHISDDGRLILIGAPGNGQVVVHARADPAGPFDEDLYVIPSPDAGSNDQFGIALTSDQTGNDFFVGAPTANQGDVSRAGAVHVFKIEHPIESPIAPIERINASEPQYNAYFGRHIFARTNANPLIVASPFRDKLDENEEGHGAVSIIEKGPGSMYSRGRQWLIHAVPAQAGSIWSTGLAMTRDRRKLTVGAPHWKRESSALLNTGAGSIYTFCTFNSSCRLNDCPQKFTVCESDQTASPTPLPPTANDPFVIPDTPSIVSFSSSGDLSDSTLHSSSIARLSSTSSSSITVTVAPASDSITIFIIAGVCGALVLSILLLVVVLALSKKKRRSRGVEPRTALEIRSSSPASSTSSGSERRGRSRSRTRSISRSTSRKGGDLLHNQQGLYGALPALSSATKDSVVLSKTNVQYDSVTPVAINHYDAVTSSLGASPNNYESVSSPLK